MRTVGDYRLRELLGRGASSEVYAAEHDARGDVAVKVLRPELAEDVAQMQALVEEGLRLHAIDHPNVVRVLDARIEAGGCYLVMERVRGETLAARLRREGRLPEDEVRRLGAELADGVAAAHARGIVHRDLKPANVMFDGARPKIVDFGIAKHLGARAAVTTGRMIGTLAYMAPEQLSSGMIAPCTDIWALGVILFEALAGRHPFENFADGRCPQLFDEPARVSSIVAVSPELDEILARCLAREPSRRPSAEALASLLRGEQLLDDERITADAGPLPAIAAPPSSPARPRRTPWLIGAGIVAIAAVALVVTMRREPEPRVAIDPPQPAPKAAPVVAPAQEPAQDIELAPMVVDRGELVEVRTTPRGAQVLVDGKLRGVTPLKLEVTLPEELVIRRAGYVSVKQHVERAGVVDVALHPVPRPRPTKTTRIDEPLD